MSVREMWKHIMACLVICVSVTSSAQQNQKTFFNIQSQDSPQVICASDDIHQRMLLQDEGYKQRHELNELTMERKHGQFAQRSGTVVTIPVVIHVVHLGEPIGSGTNISDAQVHSAMVALNEDFRRMPGTNGYGAGVDVEMEFCLASRDPDGHPTTGINRVNGSTVPLYASEGISAGQGDGADEVSVKDLSRWDRDSYYNIWIVNEIEDNDGGAGIQGYAYFPSSNANKDGAVILYNAFGTVGTLKSYTSLNRTMTHEIGHGFYLYHTFQGSSCVETNCSFQGDRVCDTPPTTSNTSCNSPACSGTQQVENYMDYTSQNCMDMFTQGQKDRMHANLNLFRPTLITSLGCTPPNTFDAAVTAISEPDFYACSTSISPRITLTNFGSATLSAVTINYAVDNGPLSAYNWTGNLESSGQVEVSLPAINAALGAHNLEVYTESPNGQVDQYSSNDMQSTSFEVVSGNVVNISILIDSYGAETTWDVKNAAGTVVAQGGPYPSGMNNTLFSHEVCLPQSCLDFTIYDSYGDGIWGGAGFGNYSVTDQDGNTLASGGDFAAVETTNFCLTASTNPPVADFSTDATSGCSVSTFDFVDQSTGGPTSWAWTFAGGSPSSSTQQNPTGISFNSSGPHTVTLTVSNANGSDTEMKVDMITIGAGPTLSGQVQSTSCANATDGAINLSVSGGTAPYQYNWSNNMQVQDIMGLGAGNYSVSVTDASGCSSTSSFNVSAPSAISVSMSSTNSACGNTGTASVLAAGGSAPYTYLWSNNQTGSTATGLSSGQYTVVVTDANGCQKTGSVQVDSSAGVQIITTSTTPASCGNSGTATVTASGGITPYAYTWTGSQEQTQATATGLAAGQYTVTVTDASGCQASASITVDAEMNLSLVNSSSSPASCSNDGTASVSPSGGTAPYTYLWNDPQMQTTATAVGLAPGDYHVVVTDASGCQNQKTITVQGQSPMDLTVSHSTASTCLNTGSVTIFPIGGTPPYSFLWNDSQMQTSATASALGAGVYTVVVTDANGCQASQEFQVEEIAGIDLSNANGSPATCSNNASCGISPTGGTPPYSYQWNDAEQSTSSQLSGLAAGSYTVTVTDANGCSAQRTINLGGVEAMDLSNVSSSNSSCANDGSASITVSGGTAPYSYQWNDPQGQTTATATGLSGGDYLVTVTDANGCASSRIVLVQSSSSLDLTNCAASPVSCQGGSDGSAVVLPAGGTGPFSFQWNDDNAQMGQQAIGLSAGTYAVLVTDASGCQSMKSIEVPEPDALQIHFSVTDPLCFGESNGSVQADITGGVGLYNYSWVGGTTNGSLSLNGVPQGEYQLNVTDANGCQTSSFVNVSEPDELVATVIESTPDSCGLNVGMIHLGVVGGIGQKTIQWNDDNLQMGQVLTQVRYGEYVATVSDMNACQIQESVEVLDAECSGATGLDDVGVNLDFTIFPNPLSGEELHIRFSNHVEEGTEIHILDVTGKLIQIKQVESYSTQVSLNLSTGYNTGIYFIQMHSGGHLLTRRLTLYR